MEEWINNTSLILSACANRSLNATGGGRPVVTVPVAGWPMTLFATCAIPIVICLGILGNLVSLFILKNTANSVSIHFYLSVLAVLDCLSLLSIFFSIWAGVVMRGYEWHLNWHTSWWKQMSSAHWSCQIRLYFSFTLRTLSIWTVVFFTLEHTLLIVKPLRFQRCGTTLTAKKALLGLLVGTLPISMFCFFAFDNRTIVDPCTRRVVRVCRANYVFFVGRVAQLVIHSILPWIVLLICNVLIVVTLRRRSKLGSQGNRDQCHSAEAAITRRLTAVSVAFLVLTVPMLIMSSIHTSHQLHDSLHHKKGVLADLYYLAYFLFTCHFACNFILYCCTGPVFRQAVRHLIFCNMPQMREACLTLDPNRRRSSTTQQSLLTSCSDSTRSSSSYKEKTRHSRLSHSNRNDDVQLLNCTQSHPFVPKQTAV